MLEREDRGERVHRRIWELLPWYVNGSLSEREREWVEAHLADCLRCQEEERACRGTAQALQAGGEVAPSPHPAQLRRLLDRIDQDGREERGTRARFFGGWRGIVVAQAAAILVLIGVLFWDFTSTGRAGARHVYYTLSAELPKVNTVSVRMMFKPDATEREIRDLLLEVRGQIVEGPSPYGAYIVAVPAGTDPVKALLARLRSEPQVVFAEPVAGEEPK